MNTLIIQDLSIAEELNGKAMSAVRGGYSSYSSCFKMPSCHPYEYKPSVSSTTTVSAQQQNQQFQQNDTGNGSATFGGGITAENNQQAFNVLGGFGGLRVPG
ncbi:hypothetical protein [Noviherbaspirillum pedocola]|uniref:Uncharacterized protein n=1 Tax=Noviherbaspirillum pedocola TaxID=2801341 RepID=A0A934SZ28_9BURK|nr:hypothetical protein [Noviherbaspirillum pedocola]MBK4735314.1 hypothetical protein [Noviherbaspirillum pedocola]